MSDISDEMVEAYLRAVHADWYIEMRADELRADVRAGLTAAVPLLRAQWEAGLSECGESVSAAGSLFFADQPERPPVPCVRKPLGHPLPHRAADGMEWWPIANP